MGQCEIKTMSIVPCDVDYAWRARSVHEVVPSRREASQWALVRACVCACNRQLHLSVLSRPYQRRRCRENRERCGEARRAPRFSSSRHFHLLKRSRREQSIIIDVFLCNRAAFARGTAAIRLFRGVRAHNHHRQWPRGAGRNPYACTCSSDMCTTGPCRVHYRRLSCALQAGSDTAYKTVA